MNEAVAKKDGAEKGAVSQFDRLPVKSFFNQPPQNSPYHTRRAEEAHANACTYIPADIIDEVAGKMRDAGLRRSKEDYADSADHNILTCAAALTYAGHGLHVADGHALNNDGKPTNSGPGGVKVPRGAKWQERATTDPESILEFWAGVGEYPENAKGEIYPFARVSAPRNVSIVYPTGCGLFALDVDGAKGQTELAKLEAAHGALPVTPTILSGSGEGFQMIFRTSETILNSASSIAPGIDIRGENGQSVAPPSVHPSFGFYDWEEGRAPGEVEIADAPEWLVKAALESSKKTQSGRRVRPEGQARSVEYEPKEPTGASTGSDARLLDIGDDAEGFDKPIYRAACAWFSAHGWDADASTLFDELQETIIAAHCDDNRNEDRYATPEYLDERIEQARDYIRDCGEEGGEEVVSEGPGTPGVRFCTDVLAPLYDTLLVDGEGFLRGPADHKALYAKYSIKPGVSDEEQQRAYKAMVRVVRDQIREAMRARFSYVVTGDKARAGVRTAPGRAVSWYDEGALDRLFRNREVAYYVANGKGEPKIEKLKPAQLFMYDRDRQTYSKTDFEPDSANAEEVEAEGAFNLWTGFAVAPEEGDWSLLRNHVLNVICGGDVALFNWHMTFLASLFARPGVKVPSSIAVKGEQGTGKSKLWDWVRSGLGCTAMKVSQGKHLVGQFNGHLEGKVLLVCEEAFWAGDKAAAGVIKDLISAEELVIEAKHQNAETRKNRICVVFISNNDWIIPTDGSDARRFAVFEATNDHKQDAPYFAAIDRQMKTGGVEAMVHELTHWNPDAVGLTWDSLRSPPETEYLRQQAGMGLNGPLAALVDVLESGKVEGRTESGDVFYYELSDSEVTRVERSHLNAVLGIKKGRGNETAEGVKAIETLFGADAIHGNKAQVVFEGRPDSDGVRPVINTRSRVRFVDVPPLDDMKEVLARYGRG